MSSPARRYAWILTKLLVGTLVFAIASALVFLLVDNGPLVRPIAWIAVATAMIAGPLGLTRLLMPAAKRLDPRTGYGRVLPGVAGWYSFVGAVALTLFARPSVSEALAAVGWRYRSVPPIVRRASVALSKALAPTPSAPAHAHGSTQRQSPAVGHAADAGVSESHVADAGVRLDGAVAQHSTGIADMRDGGTGMAHAPAPHAPASSTLSVCDHAQTLWAGEIAHGPPDELVVACNDGVQVLWFRTEGAVVRRSRLSYRAPADTDGAHASVPRVADLDGDGHLDLAVCLYWSLPQGGTRGGGSWWLPGRDNGQFGAPAVLQGGACGAIEVGDINGDTHPELLIADYGNPYDPTNPNGELFWYARPGTRWLPRGHVRLRRGPINMWLSDVDGDGVLDAMVEHDPGWNDVTLVILGSRTGPLAVDANQHPSARPNRTYVEGDFDGDGTRDSAQIVQGHIELRLSSPTRAPASPTEALDYAEFVVP